MASNDTWLLDSFFTQVRQPSTLAAIATIFVLLVTTRALSGGQLTSTDGTKLPAMQPYWLPFIGHAPQMTLNPGGLLRRLRQLHPEGLFSVKSMGRTHSFIFKPSFASTVDKNSYLVADASPTDKLELTPLQNPPEYSETYDEEGVVEKLGLMSFGLSPQCHDLYADTFSHLNPNVVGEHLFSKDSLSSLTNAVITQVKENVADWITLNAYPADQMEWERLAGADAVDNDKGERVMEVDLMELTRNFIAKTVNAALFGTDFAENYPDTGALLWRLDRGFSLLSSKLPSWIPLPQLQRARATRRQLLSYMTEFETAMDKFLDGEEPGVKWLDLDNASDIVKDRAEQFRKGRLPIAERAAFDISLAWDTNSSTNVLVAWMLFELSRDVILLEQVREEIAPFVKITQPKSGFAAVWVAPSIETFDMDGLLEGCPLLKAAYVETLRMYTGASTTRLLRKDIVLGKFAPKESYLLKKGTYVHVPQELHQMDPDFFTNPTEWNTDRHIVETTDESGRKTRVVDMGTMKPFGSGSRNSKGQEFAMREVILFTSILITLYEIHPAGGQWKVPRTTKPVTTKYPTTPIRVWISRRELAAEGDTGDEK